MFYYVKKYRLNVLRKTFTCKDEREARDLIEDDAQYSRVIHTYVIECNQFIDEIEA